MIYPEKPGAGCVKQVRRNTELIRHVNHGTAEQIKYNPGERRRLAGIRREHAIDDRVFCKGPIALYISGDVLLRGLDSHFFRRWVHLREVQVADSGIGGNNILDDGVGNRVLRVLYK
nr:hypothetical protein Itr_chr03CG22380 [Ipomoea trifida]